MVQHYYKCNEMYVNLNWLHDGGLSERQIESAPSGQI